MNNEPAPLDNPYAAPQAELLKAPPKVIYTNKFNGRIAFWSAIFIAALMSSLYLPEVKTHRSSPRTTIDYLIAFTMIGILSSSIGLYLGSVSGTRVQQQSFASKDEPPTDEPYP